MEDSTRVYLQYVYDEKNRKILEKRKIRGDIWQIFQYTYDAGGRLTGMGESADREGYGKNRAWTGYTYDARGNVTRIHLPEGGDPAGVRCSRLPDPGSP